MTNGDKIRSMSDEELARWLQFVDSKCPPTWKPSTWKCATREHCSECWLAWLRADGDGKEMREWIEDVQE